MRIRHMRIEFGLKEEFIVAQVANEFFLFLFMDSLDVFGSVGLQSKRFGTMRAFKVHFPLVNRPDVGVKVIPRFERLETFLTREWA